MVLGGIALLSLAAAGVAQAGTETFYGSGTSVQVVTLQEGNYQFTVDGAQGGGGVLGLGAGGKGAQVVGDFAVYAPTQFDIIVGGAGLTGNGGGGGGGGTFVIDMATGQVVFAAGGGGGGGSLGTNGGAGSATNNGTTNGGARASLTVPLLGTSYYGAGGAGLTGDGASSKTVNGVGNGGQHEGPGGPGYAVRVLSVTLTGGAGGYGGGGGGYDSGGGGGGGYNGGAGGTLDTGGQGGGSYHIVSATNVVTTAGFESGNGLVQITAVPEPATWAMLILGLGALGVALRRRPVAVAA